MRDITIGQYYPSESVVHSLDPRTKLMGTFLFIVTLFITKNPWWYIPSFILVLAVYRLAKVPFGYLLKGLRGIIILLLFTFFFRMTITSGEVFARLWIFEFTWEGLRVAIRMTSRIALMIVSASLLSYTSTSRMLADGLERSCRFLEKMHVSVHEMALIVMIAFRFIPVMIEEMNNLMDAQASRGVEFKHCSVAKKCKNIYSVLVPLFLSTVRRSSDLAMAMEARGYRGEGPTTKMYPLVYTKADRIAYGFMILYFLVIVAGRVRLG